MKQTSQTCRYCQGYQCVSYKVWLEIEQFNPHTQDGVNVDAPGGPLAEFDTYQEARDFAESVAQNMSLACLPGVAR